MELRRPKDAASRPTRKIDDTVGWYLDKVKRHEVLEHPAVIELFKRVENGDKRAFNELVEKNLKLVVAVARSYRDKGVDFEDLLQEGNMGLIHAIEKFEYKKGYKFGTYAVWWIRQRISHYLSTQRNSIRVPTHAMRLKKHIDKAIENFKKDGVNDPSWEMIADVIGSSPDVVEATMSGSKNTISLSQPYGKESDAPLFSLESESADSDPEATFSTVQMRSAVLSSIQSMDELNKQIVMCRINHTSDKADTNRRLLNNQEIMERLHASGVDNVTPSIIKQRLRDSMNLVVSRSCEAMGIDELSEDDKDKIACSRAFHEAVAAVINDEDTE